ncbi:FO synthase subunit 1 [Methanohalophilus levihalophilus]|uniref:7,8-didemethyl-8-hydroxy-5-deazariboflavin synthase subunit CofG n=1 Tax=Methanohalophilus levihalophilus TaxID=1431282 RepID=UPI001AE4921A|nr:7,8-didemethyl-8-hydroxy-5-deazariboflavin synthase subunit CofG [Methanohalophilus levihalophilus]MBP2030969.1 FO synthase subunit 1 [Methanohalophilus levihalophilus]
MPEYVTFARNVFIPVTNVCRNKCGYCTFRREPDSPEARLMTEEEVRPILQSGVDAGCTEALFVFGEYAEEVPEYRKMLAELGYDSTLDYVYRLCEMAIEIGIMPHTNAGILSYQELEKLKPVNASMGLMLETLASLKAHENSPGKKPDIRIRMIEDAGKLQIPFTTGILVGIGETKEDRIESLQKIAEIHEKYSHIQEVIIQNFMPKPGTEMEGNQPPTKEEMMETVRLAREILPEDVEVQVAPNLIDPYSLVKCGAGDLGGISPTTIDWINPEAEWPDVEKLRKMLKNIPLRERLPIYPKFIKKEWHGKTLDKLISSLADDEGYRA